MKNYRFDHSRNVSSFIAFCVISLLGIVVAILTIRASRDIVSAAPQSPSFNIDKRDIK